MESLSSILGSEEPSDVVTTPEPVTSNVEPVQSVLSPTSTFSIALTSTVSTATTATVLNGNTLSTPTKHDKGLPKAMVKPNVLTHVIGGFVIQEADEPFPVTRQRYAEADEDEPPSK